jgi:hypothetical protein
MIMVEAHAMSQKEMFKWVPYKAGSKGYEFTAPASSSAISAKVIIPPWM